MLALNFDYTLKINTAPRGEEQVWAEVSEGFDKIGKSLKESVYQGSYLGDRGYSSTEVTGGQLSVTLSGVRIYGDPAQDYIFSDTVKNNYGEARKTDFMIIYPNGEIVSGKVTLAKITEGGGNSNAPDAISVEIHFNGKPKSVAAD
ncbi:MAG: hypothetical protein FWG90_10710 [Oscillospiraceae bacterium]|nr:hypothetical protein [Oscillospiraceae bacterium]